jgi:hypothetical protein
MMGVEQGINWRAAVPVRGLTLLIAVALAPAASAQGGSSQPANARPVTSQPVNSTPVASRPVNSAPLSPRGTLPATAAPGATLPSVVGGSPEPSFGRSATAKPPTFASPRRPPAVPAKPGIGTAPLPFAEPVIHVDKDIPLAADRPDPR